MRYQQFASHAYCEAAGPVSKMASQQEKTFCVLRFEVSRFVITVQREFVHGLELLVYFEQSILVFSFLILLFFIPLSYTSNCIEFNTK
jgi:hypothetical protein